MKFSYNWLREMVMDLDTPARGVEKWITLKTAECEGVEEVGAALANACVAEVVSAEPVGKGHNRKVVVNTERYGAKTVICGASNCRPGLRTAYVPLGKKMIEGVESDGMLASAVELGIGRDHDGIIELTGEFQLAPDYVIEVDNKSLTHRPDLWGHYGMAREVAAILSKQLSDPVPAPQWTDAKAAIAIQVENYDLCPRYSALVLENVTIQPSPLWLQYRLEAIGLNPINNVVDVTNYVLAELAQPMHAFDANKVRGGIRVRPARTGEKFAALNGERYTLDNSNLVIADDTGPVALAGIIGGADSAISDGTRRIVLESANFNASSVRKTSSKLRLRTDASMRFEKAQDPVNTVRGLARAYALLQLVSPGVRLTGGLGDDYRPLPQPAPIELPLDWLDRKLGRAMEQTEVRRILESLAFTVEEPSPRVFTVGVPSWRATKDISVKDDLVEEVGRMVGYDSITPQAPSVPANVPPANPERTFHHRLREMAAAQGFTEVYNYSFMNAEAVRTFGLAPEDVVTLLNPISADQNLMRQSLLPGILKNLAENARHLDSFRLFEIGRAIHRDREDAHLVAAILAKDDGAAALLELKRLAACLIPGVSLRPADARSYEHPLRSADVTLDGASIGRLFEFHPNHVEHGRAAVIDLNLSLVPVERQAARYQVLRRFPSSAFDLSVVAQPRAQIGVVQSQLKGLAASDLAGEIVFLRDFALPDGNRSLSFRITVGADDRTLSAENVGEIRQRIIDGMQAQGYELKV